MTKTKLFFAIAALFLAGQCQPAQAGCWCKYPIGLWEWCLAAPTLTPGTTVVTYTVTTLATDAKNIDGCTGPGATPPSKVCLASGGSVDVLQWSVTGTANYEIFGVSATVGGTQTINANCGGGVTINSWCSCCKTRAALRYKNTYGCGTCDCILGCTDSFCGTNTTYDSLICDEPGCTIASPCDPNCTG